MPDYRITGCETQLCRCTTSERPVMLKTHEIKDQIERTLNSLLDIIAVSCVRRAYFPLFLLLCVQDIFEIASSLGSDVDRYIIIIKLLDSASNVQWEPKSPYRRSSWIHRDFYSVRLPTQVMTHPQRCFRQCSDEISRKQIFLNVFRKLRTIERKPLSPTVYSLNFLMFFPPQEIKRRDLSTRDVKWRWLIVLWLSFCVFVPNLFHVVWAVDIFGQNKPLVRVTAGGGATFPSWERLRGWYRRRRRGNFGRIRVPA
jgi:hypothetical protein